MAKIREAERDSDKERKGERERVSKKMEKNKQTVDNINDNIFGNLAPLENRVSRAAFAPCLLLLALNFAIIWQ